MKAYPVQIWFLDNDLKLSAQALTNRLLHKNIVNCVCSLIAAYMYCIGIRSVRHYKHYFDKTRIQETMERFFPLWPLKMKPCLKAYNGKESKWCRKCKEHYDFIMKYLDILLDEYEFRFNKPHMYSDFFNWATYDMPSISLQYAKINKIVLPWKVLNPFYRRKNIIEGYRLQYKKFLQKNDGVKTSDFKQRDVPEWLMDEKFKDKWME